MMIPCIFGLHEWQYWVSATRNSLIDIKIDITMHRRCINCGKSEKHIFKNIKFEDDNGA